MAPTGSIPSSRPMDRFVKPTKPGSLTKTKASAMRNHPYKSEADLIKEKCCVSSRPAASIFASPSRGDQAPQGPGYGGGPRRDGGYFHSRNLKLASQFNQPSTDSSNPSQPSEPAIFQNCCVYINGYMGTQISDIELKRRLARHGARIVASFGRKSVTHVILGPNRLAAGKIQKEMEAKKNGVKYVTVDWYESRQLELIAGRLIVYAKEKGWWKQSIVFCVTRFTLTVSC